MQQGVRSLTCSIALHEHQRGDVLIPEFAGQPGTATVMAATIESGSGTMVFRGALVHVS